MNDDTGVLHFLSQFGDGFAIEHIEELGLDFFVLGMHGAWIFLRAFFQSEQASGDHFLIVQEGQDMEEGFLFGSICQVKATIRAGNGRDQDLVAGQFLEDFRVKDLGESIASASSVIPTFRSGELFWAR